MAIYLKDAELAPLAQCTVSAPDGAFIGIAGENGSGQTQLLRLVAGIDPPTLGTVQSDGPKRYLGPGSALDFSPVSTLALDHALALYDPVVRAQARASIVRLRKTGATILMASHELDWMEQVCDEVWWLRQGRIEATGDPREVLDKFRHHAASRIRALGAGASPIAPSIRRGDGRAQLTALQLLGANGQPAAVLTAGEMARVKVDVEFKDHVVADPVVGIMIRTRIGFEVYGTNTELERLKLGPCEAGSKLAVTFEFRADLCPNEYTITAASHDPDGVWHDWMEDALAFTVADTRYTAGVANLRAVVTA